MFRENVGSLTIIGSTTARRLWLTTVSKLVCFVGVNDLIQGAWHVPGLELAKSAALPSYMLEEAQRVTGLLQHRMEEQKHETESKRVQRSKVCLKVMLQTFSCLSARLTYCPQLHATLQHVLSHSSLSDEELSQYLMRLQEQVLSELLATAEDDPRAVSEEAEDVLMS